MDTLPKLIEKVCKKHGLTTHSLYHETRYICNKCRTVSVNKCQAKVKFRAVEYKGGKCERCGYSKCIGALHFHHKDPTKKNFTIATRSRFTPWKMLIEELDKCELLCANCHAETHWNNG